MKLLERVQADTEFKKLRDSFFTPEEVERFNLAMKNPLDRIIHAKLSEQRSYVLYEKASKLINDLENGKYDDENVDSVKIKIAHYLAAHDDVEEFILN